MPLRNFFKPLILKIKRGSILFFITKYVLYTLMRLLFATYRLKVVLGPGVSEDFRQNIGVFYFWHQQMVAAAYFLIRFNRAGGCIVSGSNDGRLAGAVVELFGYNVIYGSAFKNPIQVTRQALKILRDDQPFCIVGDGSRGPAFEFKQGVSFLAVNAKKPLFFVDCTSSWHFTFKKSWDKFQLPLPFSKININVSKQDPVTLMTRSSQVESQLVGSNATNSNSDGDVL